MRRNRTGRRDEELLLGEGLIDLTKFRVSQWLTAGQQRIRQTGSRTLFQKALPGIGRNQPFGKLFFRAIVDVAHLAVKITVCR